MLKRIALVLLLALVSRPAWAGETPLYQPAPAWVLTAATPDLTKLDGSSPIFLVDDLQTSIDGDKSWQYVELTKRVASAQMLDQAGSITLEWNPDLGDLIIHDVEILRGGEVVDLVKNGAKFEVLRREQKLDQRVMDGLRTAVLTVPGLRVGDVLRLRYSITERDTALGGRVQALSGLVMEPTKLGFGRVRVIWPAGQPVQWRVLVAGVTAKPVTRAGMTELTFSMPLPKPEDVPADAPLRYRPLPLLEISNFGSWSAVSQAMAPLYKTDGLIAPGGPLAAEVEKIRAAETDPVKRAALALQLVQDKISYFYKGLNGGSYRPQSPEDTWSLRYGDCKAKTVLLLAILRALDIKADPVLAHLQLGDAIPLRLPTPGAFNHVLVLAHINGTDYWLDGTDRGTRLADLNDVPDLRHVLPVLAGGSDLMEVPFRVGARPDLLADVVLDNRAGLALPSLFRATVSLHGALAQQINDVLQQADDKQKRDAISKFMNTFVGGNILSDYAISFDAEDSNVRFTVGGITGTDWSLDDRAYTMTLDQTVTNLNFDPDRARAAWQAIPVATGDASHVTLRRQVLLPDDGTRYRLEGDQSFAMPLAGSKVERTVTQKADSITLVDDVRTIAPEISPADLTATRGVVARATAHVLKIKAPQDYPDRLTAIAQARKGGYLQPLLDVYTKRIAVEPKEDSYYSGRAAVYGFVYDFKAQLADLDRLVALAPSAGNYSWRADVRDIVGDRAGALADARKALELEPGKLEYASGLANQLIESKRKDEGIALIDQWIDQGGKDKPTLLASKANLLARAGDVEGALAASDASMAAGPATADLLNSRCWLKGQLNVQLDTALKECSRSIEQADSALAALDSRALIYFRMGRYDDALADLKAVLDENPDAVGSRYLRGVVRARQGDAAGGAADMAAARAMWPPIDRNYVPFGIKP